jgi:peptide/nickel transport system substrate-binding protein
MKLLFTKVILIVTFAVAAQAAEKTLNIGVQQEWDIVHPISYNTATTEGMKHMLQREMTFQDEQGVIQPEIAISIPSLKNKKAKIITENGTRKVQAKWEIKKEAVWSDKTPITCDDWNFAWQVGMNENVFKSEKEIFSKIEKIEWAPDKNKICTVTYASDNWTFDRDLPPFLPKHLESAIYEQYKNRSQAYEQNSLYVTKPNTPGLYSGPYTVEEMKIRSHVIMKANPNFWGEKPKINKIIFKHVADANTFRALLESKQINMISGVGFPPDMAINFAEEEKGKTYRVHFITSALFQGMFFNLDNEFLKEKAIREALSLTVDKEKITKSFFAGKLNPAYSIIAENDPAFRNKKYPVDIKRANKLLEDAGWKFPKGSSRDGALREKNGKKLIIEYKTSSGIRILETIQGFICSEFTKIGVGCDIKNQPPREFLGESVPHGNFAIGVYGNTTLYDSSLKGQYHSISIPSAANSWAGGNSGRINDKAMDALLEKFDSSWDKKERIKILGQIDDLISKNVWNIPLYHRREATVLPSTFINYTNSPRGTNFVYPERWDF